MKRQSPKILMIGLQFLFYLLINSFFKVPAYIAYNTFFIYLLLNITKKMHSFKTILIWEEVKKQLYVHIEYLAIMIINDIAFCGVEYIPVHLIIGVTFTFFNLLIISLIRKIFRRTLEKRLIIIGIGHTARELTQVIKENDFTMYNLLGYISANTLKGINQDILIEKSKILGDCNDIERIIIENNVSEVIIALPLADNNQMAEIINKLDGKVERIKFTPELNGTYTFNSEIEDYDGIMLISSYNGMNKTINRFLKRSFDIVARLVGCIVLGILYLIYAPKIKKDGGKAIFYHTRIGKDLKSFKMYKFRTMYVDAEKRLEEMLSKDEKLREEYYKNFKLKDDPRITEVGKFLRKTSLDEFPQFINVIKGEMSFVGPRPVVQKEVDMYYGEENSRKIFMVKPGITGMWQANGRSDVENYDERIALDLYYIRNWSLWLDVTITIKTIKNVIGKKGAY
ncbi:sugar transferase [Fusobacterium varium]|uniref:Sugar transferase n=1 Tax=Fusobacterium varium ATCC 27725 TaxID=469618 RepID=A0ABM6U0U9_FUSVA|nr:sugar transferase [Fusobacterium varium]AVQ29851.1 sugar transferase [Fusobacterium varium ATCC 27725]EES65144.1 exopolysaccharide biosynthesis polyprenyl glycosylphosphotransferase [Fusobacterium varium ATCC 27725]VEH38289.1 Putative colanic biosynthesis UDP-glucose lipid carrier transferase [Fusobacterium varium]